MDWVQQTPGLSYSGQAEPQRRGEMQARKAGSRQRVGVSCLGQVGPTHPSCSSDTQGHLLWGLKFLPRVEAVPGP